LALVVLAVALGVAPPALASPVAEVLDPSGHVVAAPGSGAFAYPADGSLLWIPASSSSGDTVQLDNVSLLGGRVLIGTVSVSGRSRSVRVDGLVVDGRAVSAGPNRLVPVGPATYLITDQTAVAGSAKGVVGIRLAIGDAGYGAPVGTEIVVGLPAQPRPRRQRRTRASADSPLAILGFVGSVRGGPWLTAPVFASDVGGTSIGDKAAALAERYLGVPYVWGGASPSQGFDCSGLAMYVYAQLGIHLTHYTGAQYYEGASVPRSELQPGDLVFFEPSAAGPQHEGIYVGDGEFVQAPHTGDVVRISSLSDPAYALGYVGAVRPYTR
jgi:NlpC/P60 family